MARGKSDYYSWHHGRRSAGKGIGNSHDVLPEKGAIALAECQQRKTAVTIGHSHGGASLRRTEHHRESPDRFAAHSTIPVTLAVRSVRRSDYNRRAAQDDDYTHAMQRL